MSPINVLQDFVIDYLKIISVRTPDLKLLKKLCNNTAPLHIYTIIKGCTRHNIRHELRDTPESLLKDYENDHRTCLHVAVQDRNFEMIDILFEKLSDAEMLHLLQLTAADKSRSVTWSCIWNGGVTWAMELAKSATHEALKTEIYQEVLGYTCQYDDAQALQILLSTVTSDKLMSLLSTIRHTDGLNYIQNPNGSTLGAQHIYINNLTTFSF